jgi:regulator of sigma E protease
VLVSFAAFIIVIGVLITVHELGHFLAAKAVGIQVLRFSIGFGPPVVSWQRGETEYRLAWIPLGGYVKMAGLEEEGVAGELEGGAGQTPVDPARAFDRKPVWARIIVLAAGVIMNAVLALTLYAGLGATVGVPEAASTRIDSVAVRELPAGAEELAALRFGDRIVRVNGDTVRSWNDVLAGLLDTTRAAIRVEVEGRPEPLVARVTEPGREPRAAIARALIAHLPPRFGIVLPGQPGGRAGLQPGDLVLRIDGDTVRTWRHMVEVVRAHPGRPLRLDVQGGRGPVRSVTVVPAPRTAADTAGGGVIGEGVIGVQAAPDRHYVRLSLGAALVAAVDRAASDATAIARFLGRLVSGRESVRQIGGPVLIGQISGQVVRMGLHDFLVFIGFFSIQLAVLNLLPIPVLDGGHLVFLLIEGLRGRPIPATVRLRLLNIGFWILIAIMLIAVGNDVLRLLPG